MRTSVLSCLLLVAAMFYAPAAADLLPYNQNFEAMTPNQQTFPNSLSQDGWLVGANVYNASGVYQYNYFAFPAPNGGPAFSGVATAQGGPAQGDKQLSVYSDYNNTDHANPDRRIESFVFRDIGVITAADVGKIVQFSFDAKKGDLIAPTTSTAFLKVLDLPTFNQLGISSVNTTNFPTTWSFGTLSLLIDSSWVGDLVQIGFTNTAGGYNPSGMFYDNVNVRFRNFKNIPPVAKTGITAIPEPGAASLLALGAVMAFSCRRRPVHH
jgi:hypothetical protein